MADDNTYAPKSPDLSSLYSGGPTVPATELNLPPQQSPPPEQSSHHPHQSYKLESPPYGYGAYAPPLPIEHQQYQHQHHQPHPHLSPTAHPHQLPVKAEYHQGYPAPIQQHHQPHHYLGHNSHAAPPPPGYDYGVPPQHYQHAPYDNPLVEQPPYLAQAPYAHPYPPQAPHHGSPQLPPPHNIKAEPPLDSEMPPRRAAAAPAPVLEPSPVKTKFPTARIKRIMQADEEVGKVAQQTPIAVGKALEMFMVQMVTKSAEVAKDKGSKRVSAQMLKQVVETDEQWDFLREIVGRVENEKEGGRAKKVESESEEEVPEPKKKARGGRRKKD